METPCTVAAAVNALANKKTSAADLVEHSLDKIGQWEPHINALIEVLPSEARSQASRCSKNNNTTLKGIPIAVKDVICTTEGHTTAASNILRNHTSPFAASVITKLKSAGAIMLAKANCDAFAMGVSTEYSDFGSTKNPWDTTRVPGGSSGGSAAAVASGEVLAALGTDTGGSIRHPASFCGVVGLRPSYGRVSRFGCISYGSSLDQIGPITKTVKDAAIILSVIAGHDSRDATSSAKPVGQYVSACQRKVKGLKVGLPEQYFGQGVQQPVANTVRTAIDHLGTLGVEIIPISLPLTPATIPTYYLIAKAEGSSNLGRYDALRYAPVDVSTKSLIEHYLAARGQHLGPEVKRTILMGTYALSAGYYDAWYKQASKVRTLVRREFDQSFNQVDLIASPTTPETAFTIGSRLEDPLAMYMSDALTTAASVAGLPAISVPCGFVNKLPVGLQLIAPHFQEERLFQLAYAYEQSTEWHKKEPAISELPQA